MELAAKDIKDTQGGATPLPTPVNKVQQGQGGAAKGTKNSLSCYRCGGKLMASRCRFKTENIAHVARQATLQKCAALRRKKQQTHTVEEASLPEDSGVSSGGLRVLEHPPGPSLLQSDQQLIIMMPARHCEV